MTWLSVNLRINSSGTDEFGDHLLELGAIAVDIDPARDPAKVAALFRPDTDVSSALAAAAACSGIEPAPGYSVSRVADRDWVCETQDQFPPIQITPKLYVVPSWSQPPDASAVSVRLDPGLAFGTGGHPTTRLCLRWLSDTIRGGESVIDYGCGSGILAIAALKLGAARAIGVDNDEDALKTSRANAAQNDVSAQFCLPRDCRDEPADIVVANILLHPLTELAPRLAELCRGYIALSGVLEREREELERCYAQWFAIEPGRSDEGWALVVGSRR